MLEVLYTSSILVSVPLYLKCRIWAFMSYRTNIIFLTLWINKNKFILKHGYNVFFVLFLRNVRRVFESRGTCYRNELLCFPYFAVSFWPLCHVVTPILVASFIFINTVSPTEYANVSTQRTTSFLFLRKPKGCCPFSLIRVLPRFRLLCVDPAMCAITTRGLALSGKKANFECRKR